jgi:hypothetical protein
VEYGETLGVDLSDDGPEEHVEEAELYDGTFPSLGADERNEAHLRRGVIIHGSMLE